MLAGESRGLLIYGNESTGRVFAGDPFGIIRVVGCYDCVLV